MLRIEKTENDVSHQLIEECMLLANEAVAGRLMSQHTSGGLSHPRSRRTTGVCRNIARRY
jgi:exoribonuclease R